MWHLILTGALLLLPVQQSCIEEYYEELNKLYQEYSLDRISSAEIREDIEGIEHYLWSGDPLDAAILVQEYDLSIDSVLTIKGSSLAAVRFGITSFDKEAYEIQYCDDKIYYIDGKVHPGTKYLLPDNVLREINFSIDGKSFSFPQGFSLSLFNINDNAELFYDSSKDIYFLAFSGGDGGAFFQAVIAFDRQKIIGTTLSQP